jgi:PAS domain S-box-containing protein
MSPDALPTDLQGALRRLAVSESRLAEAQEVAHIGSWEWNVADNSEWWSDELYRICGFEPKSFNPSFDTFRQLLHPDDIARVEALIRRALEDRQPFNFEHRIVRPDGGRRTLMARCRVIVDEAGTVVRMIGTAQDVTDWRQLQDQVQQSQRMDTARRLADGIAHEFNNLLTIIGGYTDAALAKIDEHHPLAPDLREVRNAATFVASLTRQLLMLKGAPTGQAVTVELNGIVANLETLLRRTLGENIQVITSLPIGVRPIRADLSQLRQVIMNLAVNARDAMPQGGTLTIETRNGEPPHQDLVELIVSDTGRGMDAATCAQIFEPFFTTKEPGQGSGLGLSTVYGIVQGLDGAIAVESEPGRGSTFMLRFPATAAQAEPARSAPSANAAPTGTETILIVEDDPIVRQLTARLLRDAGYRVLEAPSSARALALVKDTAIQIDLLLTDLILPGLNGVQLFEVFRRSRADARVLYMSGYTKQAIGELGLTMGDQALLHKPFMPAMLLQRVRGSLDETLTT